MDTGCAALASILEHRIEDLQHAKHGSAASTGTNSFTPPDTPLPSQRIRSLPHRGLSEPEIVYALTTFCTHVRDAMKGHKHAHSERLQHDCQELLPQESLEALEEHIFSEGSAGLRMLWCVSIAGVCETHTLIDGGEL